MSELILLDRADRIATVTLNRPEHLNALSAGLRRAIVDTFRTLKDDAETEVIILTGAGRAFTAGLDLKELGGERDSDLSPEETVSSRDLSEALAAVPQPIIGAINGYAITGGFEVALMCDFLIAASTAALPTRTRAWGLYRAGACLSGCRGSSASAGQKN